MKKVLCVLFIILLPIATSQLIVNEVMSNPEKDPVTDKANEWVELYYSGSGINIEGAVLEDSAGIDSIECCSFLDECDFDISDDTFIIISDQDSTLNLGEDVQWLCVEDEWIGNRGLRNDWEEINISLNGNVLAYFKYNESTSQGRTLALINGSWHETEPTPGSVNILQEITEEQGGTDDLEIEVALKSVLFLHEEYTTLFKITNNNYVSGQIERINISVAYNVTKGSALIKEDTFNADLKKTVSANTGYISFDTAGVYTVCGQIIMSSVDDSDSSNDWVCKTISVLDTSLEPCSINLSIATYGQIYNNSEKLSYDINLNNETYPFEITYWIDDLFGYTVKTPYVTTNTNKKSYTPSISETDQVLVLKANISWISCNDSENKDNYAEQLLIIKGNKEAESKIEIEEIYLGSDYSAKFGETIKAKISAYKGDSSKSSIKLWIEKNGNKASYISYANLYEKYSSAVMSIPVRIKANCNENLDSGTYYLYAEAFDETDKESMKIRDLTSSLCKSSSSATAADTSATDTQPEEYTLISYTNPAFINTVIQSNLRIINNENTKNTYKIWSYVYRGPKCYSGDREDNLVEHTVSQAESIEINMSNIVRDAEPGDYKIKVKIEINGKITELTRDIVLLKNQESDTVPSIIRFYTLSKKIDENLNLYVTLDDYEDTTIELEGSLDNISAIPIAKRTKFNVNLVDGKNIFIARLYKDSILVDTKGLVLDADIVIKTSKDAESDNPVLMANVRDHTSEETNISKENIITGAAVKKVYESAPAKMSRLIPLFLVILGISALFILKKID